MSLVRAYHAGYASEIQPFLDGAVGIAESHSTVNWLCKPNYRSKEYFGLDGELINRLRPDLEKQYAGFRMAYCLDDPILPDGHLFPRQQIQICLWNCQVIRNPRKYVGSSFLGL